MTSAKHEGRLVKADGLVIECPFTASKAWWDASRRRFIVLMDYYANRAAKRFANIEAYDGTGTCLWTAALPEGSGPDAYTEAEITSAGITAYSFSGNRCLIDSETGQLLRQQFVK